MQIKMLLVFQKLILKLKALFHLIKQGGVKNVNDYRLDRSIAYLNMMILWGSLVTFLFLLFYLFQGYWLASLTTIPGFILLGACFISNNLGYYHLTQILVQILGNGAALIGSLVLGYYSMIHVLNFYLFVAVPFLAPNTNKKLWIGLFLIPSSCLIFVDYFKDQFFTGVLDLPQSAMKLIPFMPTIGTSLMIIVTLVSIRDLLFGYYKKKEKQDSYQIEKAKINELAMISAGVENQISSFNKSLSTKIDYIERMLNSKNNLDLDIVYEEVLEFEGRLGDMSNVIRGVKRLSRKSQVDDMTANSLKDIIDEALALQSAVLKSMDIKVESVILNRDLMIYCHPDQILQTVLNLISNAIDSVSEQAIRVIAILVMEKERVVELKVVDSGKKIEKNIEKSMFQPFFTTKTDKERLGLGLSTALNIVKRHNGRIEYLDKESQNAFRLTLPKKQMLT